MVQLPRFRITIREAHMDTDFVLHVLIAMADLCKRSI